MGLTNKQKQIEEVEHGGRRDWNSKLVEFFVGNPRLVILLAVAILLGGAFSLLSLQREGFPAVPMKMLFVQTVYPGAGSEEVGRIAGIDPARDTKLQRGQTIVRIDRRYFRAAEVDTLLGDATKARTKLGWTPEISFAELVAEMVREDLCIAQRDELVKRHGHAVQNRNDG